MRLFEAEARDAGLLPRKQFLERPLQGPDEEPFGSDLIDSGRWMTFVQLAKLGKEEFPKEKPQHLRGPQGKEVATGSWADLLRQTAEWLIREGLLAKADCPVTVGRKAKICLIHTTPEHPDGHKSKQSRPLSSGLYIELQWGSRQIARRCGELVEKFGQDPAQFHVRLRQ